MQNKSCNATTFMLLKNMSDFCLNKEPDFSSQCFPLDYHDLKVVEAVWCIFFALSGFTGNLLTLLAIPYAAKKHQ